MYVKRNRISFYLPSKVKVKRLKFTLIRTSWAFGGSTCTSSIVRVEPAFQAMAARHVIVCWHKDNTMKSFHEKI